jgi:hypothetical protein
LSNLDERHLLSRYKKFYKKDNIKLRTNKKLQVSILTKSGKLDLARYVLRPLSKNDYDLLSRKISQVSILHMDKWIVIHKFSHQITPLAMLDIAFWASKEPSYRATAHTIKKILDIDTSHETVRMVTDAVGKFAYGNEPHKASPIIENH